MAAVIDAEGDVDVALASISKLQLASNPLPLPSVAPLPQTAEQIQLKKDLMKSVKELQHRNCIFGPPPTLEELVNPVKEQEDKDSPYLFAGGDEEIVAQVQAKLAADAIEIDSDDEDGEDDSDEPGLSTAEMLHHARMLERASLRSDVKCSANVLQVLWCFQVELTQKQLRNTMQTMLMDH